MGRYGHESIAFDVERNYLIDYLTFSFSNEVEFSKEEIIKFRMCDENSIDEVNQLFDKMYQDVNFYNLSIVLKLKESDFRFVPAANGFKFAITNDYYYFAFMHNSKNQWGKKTNFFEMKGAGCRYFESLDCDWFKLFDHFFDVVHEFNCTRFDLAIDDFTNFFEFDELQSKFTSKEFVCTARNYNVIWGFNKNTDTSRALYAGTTASNQQLNIYDKLLERRDKNIEVDVSSWIRFEFRAKGDMAKSCLSDFRKNQTRIPEFIASVIGGFFEFKEPTDTRISRCMTWGKWSDFLEQAKKHKIVNQFKVEATIERKKDWMNRSLGKLLATLYKVDREQFLFNLKSLVDESFGLLSKEHLSIVNRYFEEQGQPSITIEELRVDALVFPESNPNKYFEDGDEIQMCDEHYYYYESGNLRHSKTQVLIDAVDWCNPYYHDSNRERGLHIYSIERKNKVIFTSNLSIRKLNDLAETQRELWIKQNERIKELATNEK